MKSKISRRSFLRNIAAAGSGAAALGLLAGCSSSSTAASSGSTAAAEDKYTPGTYSASKTISYSEIGVSMTFDANSITACEITSSGEPVSYTHLDVYKRQGSDFLFQGRVYPMACRPGHSFRMASSCSWNCFAFFIL